MNHTWADPWASTVCLVSLLSHFHICIFLWLSSHKRTLIHMLQNFLFLFAPISLWSSFWEAVGPDTLVIMLMSLKLWYTPTETPVLFGFSCNAFSFFKAFYILFCFLFSNSMKHVRQVLWFPFYVFRKEARRAKDFLTSNTDCVWCVKLAYLVFDTYYLAHSAHGWWSLGCVLMVQKLIRSSKSRPINCRVN